MREVARVVNGEVLVTRTHAVALQSRVAIVPTQAFGHGKARESGGNGVGGKQRTHLEHVQET